MYENNATQTGKSESFVNTSTQTNILNINERMISVTNQGTQTIICHDCPNKSSLPIADIETNRPRKAGNPPTEMCSKTAITTEASENSAVAEAFREEEGSLEHQDTGSTRLNEPKQIEIAGHASKGKLVFLSDK